MLFEQRYYFYIHNGIDTEHVAPMEDSWLENVLRLISGDLKVMKLFSSSFAELGMLFSCVRAPKSLMVNIVDNYQHGCCSNLF